MSKQLKFEDCSDIDVVVKVTAMEVFQNQNHEAMLSLIQHRSAECAKMLFERLPRPAQ